MKTTSQTTTCRNSKMSMGIFHHVLWGYDAIKHRHDDANDDDEDDDCSSIEPFDYNPVDDLTVASNSSSSTLSGTESASPPRVQFALNRNRIHNILAIADLTDEERANTWYTEDDFSAMKRYAKFLVLKCVGEGIDMFPTSTLPVYKKKKNKTTKKKKTYYFLFDDEEEEDDDDYEGSDYTNEVWGDTCRGLEPYHPANQTLRQDFVRQHVQAVLAAQARTDYLYDKNALLRCISIQYSIECVDEAQMWAQHDAMLAQDYLSDVATHFVATPAEHMSNAQDDEDEYDDDDVVFSYRICVSWKPIVHKLWHLMNK